jgi:YD repeat-containing protein
VLRRTYISGFRAAKEFGIGTTQAGEWYLVGDGKTFQWSALIRPGEYRVRFERSSSGTSLLNAMYSHRSSAGEWQDAHLGWTGVGWALRQADGSLAQFRPCGPDVKDVCSITRYRDADGHVIKYRRTAAGRLERMEAGPNRWIAFDYDDGNRVIRAFDSTKHEVRYEYDERGRLARVKSGGAITHRYTYTDRDEMATIIEPGTDIENTYDENGRCIRQVNRYADGSDPYIFDNAYKLDGSDVVQTDVRRSDGTWTQYTFNKNGFTTSETWGREDVEPATFVYERDPVTNAVVSLNLSCPDRTGRQLRHSSLVKPGREEWIKWDLVRTHCSLTAGTGRRWRTAG